MPGKNTQLWMIALLGVFGAGGAVGLHYICAWPWWAIAAMFVTVPGLVIAAAFWWFGKGAEKDNSPY